MNYKTKIFLQSLFVLIAFAVSLQVLADWVPPIGTPPTGGNTHPPINTGPVTQQKLDGGIVAHGIRTTSQLLVDTTSTFTGNVTMNGTLNVAGITTLENNTIISPGKTLTLNTETYTFPANQTANGYLKTDGSGILSWDTSAGGVSDGDKGDITVSGSGAVWTIDNSTITSAKITDGTIATADIADDAVNNLKILNDAVTNTKIINDAVTYAKLQNVGANSFLANTTGAPANVQEIATDRIPLFASAITGTPDASTFLRGDGSWQAAGGADNLGNHTATTQILSTLGTAAAPGYSFVGDTNNGIFSPSADTFAITTAGTERLRVSPSGQVGIGVTPSYKFQVLGQTRLVGIGGDPSLNPSLTAMTGNVGIGSSVPLELLSVGDNTNGNLGVMSLSNAVSGRVIIQPNTASFTTYTLTLPNTDGNSGEYLQTNGTGGLTWAPAGGGISGSGTANKLTKWTGASSLGDTTITEESGTNDIGINTASPGSKLSVLGNSAIGATYATLAAPTSGLIVEGTVGIGESNPTLGKLVLKGGDLAITNTGTAGLLKLYEPSASGTNFSAFRSGAQTADLTYTLPLTAPLAGEVLSSDASGNLDWVADGGSVTWSAIANPTGNQALTFDDTGTAETNTWTVNANTETFHTINANSLTTGKVLQINSNLTGSLSSGTLIDLVITGTQADNNQKALNISLSGANAFSARTTYGSYITNTHTGTTSTNVAGYFSASGGTNNYGLLVANGNVGIGTTTPTKLLDVNGDASINGRVAGRGGGNILSNTLFGGGNALVANTTGTVNSAFGYGALATNTTGAANSAFGNSALNGLSSGSDNTAIGFSSLSALITGSQNTAIGSGTIINDGLTNATAIGYGANVATSNSITFGNTSVTKSVFNGGVIVNNNNSAKPTCAVGIRGMFFVVQGNTGVKDNVEVCAKDAANTYAWRTIY